MNKNLSPCPSWSWLLAIITKIIVLANLTRAEMVLTIKTQDGKLENTKKSTLRRKEGGNDRKRLLQIAGA